jgi:hypothetical protein
MPAAIFDISKELSGPKGKGKATQAMMGELDKLQPQVITRISDSPHISGVARAMEERDAEFAARGGVTAMLRSRSSAARAMRSALTI